MIAFLFALMMNQAHATIGEATLTWTPPTRNVDGTLITNLAGFKVYYFNAATPTAVTVVDLPTPTATTTVINNPLFASGVQYCFQMTAYVMETLQIMESNKTGQACKTWAGKPNPVTNFRVE
jgi:hypothetical protein